MLVDHVDSNKLTTPAERQALTATGALGILETAAIHGLIDLLSALIRLQATSFRARLELYQDLLERNAERKLEG
jgi:hypothetical protein